MKWNQFVLGDATELIQEIEDKSVDLVFTSLPDISQTEYDIVDYKTFQVNTMKQLSRVVKDDGFVVVSQTDRKINGEILANHITYSNTLSECGMKMKDYKIVVRNEPVDKRDMYYFNYQQCVIFTRNGTIKRSGDWLKNIFIYDTKRIGKIKGPLNFYVWPEAFCRMIIDRLSKETDKVLDPFAASGISLQIAKEMNRQYLGFEISKEVYNNSIIKNAII
jgi:DNA modification methylase